MHATGINSDTTHAIERLYYRYGHSIDSGDFAALAQLMQRCSINDASGNCLAKGHEAIKAFYDQLIKIYPATGTPQTQHLISNVFVVSQSKDSLTARANYSVFQKASSGNIEAIICGQYDTMFRYVDGQWAFNQHRSLPIMIGDMSQHITMRVRDIPGNTPTQDRGLQHGITEQ